MNSKTKSILLWVFSFIFMAAVAVYQRTTGPTYPVRGKTEINGQTIKYKLIRTWGDPGDAKVEISTADTSVQGIYMFKRYKSHDEWTTAAMLREGDKLVALLPQQPAAGKVMYHVTLTSKGQTYELNKEKPAVLRYKGHVPEYILLPHIILIFLAMVFSVRAGMEAITKGMQTFKIALWCTLSFLVSGMILGPFVQKFAFDAYWTGWPFGHDLTDNKTLLAFIMWVIAVIRLYKNRANRGWAIAAAIVMLAVYLIPHSAFGSEIDYTAVKP
jgi:hypothetical protein